MSEDIKKINIAEFRKLGFLQEANRLFFHPLGMALEVVVNDDGTETLGGVWDSREDPEGFEFGNPPSQERAAFVEALRLSKVEARKAMPTMTPDNREHIVQKVSNKDT
jgi:hypothetical protein